MNIITIDFWGLSFPQKSHFPVPFRYRVMNGADHALARVSSCLIISWAFFSFMPPLVFFWNTTLPSTLTTRSLVFPGECTFTFAFGKTCLMIFSVKLASLSPPQAEQYSTSTLTVFADGCIASMEGGSLE